MNAKDMVDSNDRRGTPDVFGAEFPENENREESRQLRSVDFGHDRSQPVRSIPSPVTRQALGEPLAIEQVAELLGCSPWTVRQRYLRQGLPHLQASARGKLVFFRDQIIAWVEKRQQQRQKGGIPR